MPLFLLIPANTVGQTVQQAVEQAKDAGQKGRVTLLCISTTSLVKSHIGLCSLTPCPAAGGKGEGIALMLQLPFVFFASKALDEVYKVAETGEKAVKNVANQAASWGKSFGQ